MVAAVLNDPKAKKAAEIKMRTTHALKSVVTMAADALGQNLTEFLLQDAYKRAKEVLEERGIMVLDDHDRAAFVDAFINPPEPSDAMRKAVAAYREQPPV